MVEEFARFNIVKIILLKNCKLKRYCCGYILLISINILFIRHIIVIKLEAVCFSPQ